MINGKELMIGDYVNISRHDNFIELGIVHKICYKGKEIHISLDNIIGIFSEHEVSPIKLTEEFFLKNGFKELCKTECSTRLYNSDLFLRATITSENHFFVKPYRD